MLDSAIFDPNADYSDSLSPTDVSAQLELFTNSSFSFFDQMPDINNNSEANLCNETFEMSPQQDIPHSIQPQQLEKLSSVFRYSTAPADMPQTLAQNDRFIPLSQPQSRTASSGRASSVSSNSTINAHSLATSPITGILKPEANSQASSPEQSAARSYTYHVENRRPRPTVSGTSSRTGSESATPDEDKRRRNTLASARFRLKKKLREQELERKTRELTEKTTAMEMRIRELELENNCLKSLLHIWSLTTFWMSFSVSFFAHLSEERILLLYPSLSEEKGMSSKSLSSRDSSPCIIHWQISHFVDLLFSDLLSVAQYFLIQRLSLEPVLL